MARTARRNPLARTVAISLVVLGVFAAIMYGVYRWILKRIGRR